MKIEAMQFDNSENTCLSLRTAAELVRQGEIIASGEIRDGMAQITLWTRGARAAWAEKALAEAARYDAEAAEYRQRAGRALNPTVRVAYEALAKDVEKIAASLRGEAAGA